jgi:predicted NBD/HSP70 family sugar kinase
LRRASISFICEELIQEKLLIEGEKEESHGGRRATILTLNPTFGTFAGVYIKRSGYVVGTCDFTGAILAEKRGKVNANDPQETLENMACDLQELLADQPHLLGVGIAAPGPLDKENGKLKKVANFAGWNNLALRAYFEKAFACRCELDNVSNALAKAEAAQNKNCGKKYLELVIDEGFGSALAHVGGGVSIQECELGHTSVDMYGKKCDCGNLGCAELFVNEDRYHGTPREKEEFFAALSATVTGAVNAFGVGQAVFVGVASENFAEFQKKLNSALLQRGAEVELTETALKDREAFVACNLVI